MVKVDEEAVKPFSHGTAKTYGLVLVTYDHVTDVLVETAGRMKDDDLVVRDYDAYDHDSYYAGDYCRLHGRDRHHDHDCWEYDDD